MLVGLPVGAESIVVQEPPHRRAVEEGPRTQPDIPGLLLSQLHRCTLAAVRLVLIQGSQQPSRGSFDVVSHARSPRAATGRSLKHRPPTSLRPRRPSPGPPRPLSPPGVQEVLGGLELAIGAG